MVTRSKNGHNQLEQAMAVLINNQAQFIGLVADIKRELADIKEILYHHQRTLDALPEAILVNPGEDRIQRPVSSCLTRHGL